MKDRSDNSAARTRVRLLRPCSAMRPATIVALMLATLASAGCATGPEAVPDAPSAAGEAVTPAAPASPSARVAAPGRLAAAPSPSPGGRDTLVGLAESDAAGRAGVSVDAVRTVQVEAREWPDRSLGCPRPGVGYAQTVTPGFLIVVEAAGRRFTYHTDRTQAVYCERLP